MLPNVGWSEILVIMVLALVIFGPNRLPDIARQVGRALGELRRVSGQFQQELRSGLAIDEDPNFPYMKGPPGPEAGAAPAEVPQAEVPQAEVPQAEVPQAEVPAPEQPARPDAPAPQAPQVPERESGPSSPS